MEGRAWSPTLVGIGIAGITVLGVCASQHVALAQVPPPAVTVAVAGPGAPPPPGGKPAEKTDALLTQAQTLKQALGEHSIRITSYLNSGDLKKAQAEAAAQKTTVEKLTTVATIAASTGDEHQAEVQTIKTGGETAQNADQAAVDKATGNAGCGGQSSLCIIGGTFLAGYSFTGGVGDRTGHTGHHVIQFVVPAVGLRYAWLENVSFDLTAYSAIISPQLSINQISTAGTGCSTKQSTFNDALPCEGDAALRPYIAGFLGVTVGSGGPLGIVSVGVTAGIARTAQDGNVFGFAGLMVTALGVYGVFPLNKKSGGTK